MYILVILWCGVGLAGCWYLGRKMLALYVFDDVEWKIVVK